MLLFFRHLIEESNGYYGVTTHTSSEWKHIVMVYLGTGTGIIVYQDGIHVGTDTVKTNRGFRSMADGRVFVGLRVTGDYQRYASAYVDEIKMYNEQFSEEEIYKMLL